METDAQFFFRMGRETALSTIHSSLLEHRRYESALVSLLRHSAEQAIQHPTANYDNPHYIAGIVSVLVEAANHEPYDGVPSDTGSR